MAKERLNMLDSVRGFAACIVAFFWHYQHFTPEVGKPFYNYFHPLYSYGWLMVSCFL